MKKIIILIIIICFITNTVCAGNMSKLGFFIGKELGKWLGIKTQDTKRKNINWETYAKREITRENKKLKTYKSYIKHKFKKQISDKEIDTDMLKDIISTLDRLIPDLLKQPDREYENLLHEFYSKLKRINNIDDLAIVYEHVTNPKNPSDDDIAIRKHTPWPDDIQISKAQWRKVIADVTGDDWILHAPSIDEFTGISYENVIDNVYSVIKKEDKELAGWFLVLILNRYFEYDIDGIKRICNKSIELLQDDGYSLNNSLSLMTMITPLLLTIPKLLLNKPF